MRVQIVAQLSGTRDGEPWPARGEEMDLPEAEALQMIRSGTAKPVDASNEPEKAVLVPEDLETATAKFIPETGRHEPSVPEETIPEDDRRPNMDVIAVDDDSPSAAPFDDTTAEGKPVTTKTGPSRRVVRKADTK